MKRGFLLVALLALLGPTGAVWADEVYRLRVDGLACPFCAYGVEKNLSGFDGVRDVDILINDGVALVTTEDGAGFSEDAARGLVKTAGFTLRGFERLRENETASP